MDVVALVLAIIAAVVFLFGGELRLGAHVFGNIALGLALLTVALICQFTTISDHLINW